MPGIVLHNHFAGIVIEAVKEEVKRKINEQDKLYYFACTLPNAFKYESFYSTHKRKVALSTKDYIENHEVKKYFIELVERTRMNKDLFSLLCGQICTFYLDISVNPFIYYRSGKYNPNVDNTIKYRGFIQKTELGIDSYLIDNYYKGPKHNYFSIRRRLLKLSKLPKTIEDDLNFIYKDIYNINEGAKKINKVIKDQKRYYSFAYDPFGIKQKILSARDDGKSELDLNYITYYNKLIDTKKFDIFNLKHDKWSNPSNSYFFSIDSLFDLIERAKTMSVKCIEELYKNIFLDEEISLDYYFSDLSYLTGLANKSKQEMSSFSSIYK